MQPHLFDGKGRFQVIGYRGDLATNQLCSAAKEMRAPRYYGQGAASMQCSDYADWWQQYPNASVLLLGLTFEDFA